MPEGAEKWWDGVVPGSVEKGTRIFIFSFSLSTTFGGAIVEARSPYALLLANFNTLMAQLMFVFLSGAGKSLFILIHELDICNFKTGRRSHMISRKPYEQSQKIIDSR